MIKIKKYFTERRERIGKEKELRETEYKKGLSLIEFKQKHDCYCEVNTFISQKYYDELHSELIKTKLSFIVDGETENIRGLVLGNMKNVLIFCYK